MILKRAYRLQLYQLLRFFTSFGPINLVPDNNVEITSCMDFELQNQCSRFAVCSQCDLEPVVIVFTYRLKILLSAIVTKVCRCVCVCVGAFQDNINSTHHSTDCWRLWVRVPPICGAADGVIKKKKSCSKALSAIRKIVISNRFDACNHQW